MKKSIVALVLAGAVLSLSSCSYYSCATYAKKPEVPVPIVKQEKRYL